MNLEYLLFRSAGPALAQLLRIGALCGVLAVLGCAAQREKRIDVYEEITTWKEEGLLLVRLHRREGKLEALGETDSQQLEREEAQVLEKQTRTLLAFKDNFDFCPVYFFFSDESGKLRDGRWSEMTLLDVDGNYVDGDTLRGRPYYVAEFGMVYETLVTTETTEGEERTELGTGGKEGLVLKDSNFVQLNKPFPYKTFEFKPERAVRSLNAELRAFLLNQQRKRYMQEYLMEKE